jgi:hypothetical protein
MAATTQAARLVAAASSPESAIDAIVVGEYERAFTGTQFATLYTWCTQHGIQLWLPETGGAVDLANRDHQSLLGSPWQPSPSATCSAPAAQYWLRCTTRPPSKAATSAADHPTATGSSTPAPTPNPADARWGR